MDKIPIFMLALIIGCLFLIGCDNKMYNDNKLLDGKSVTNKDLSWYSSYSLETDKITITIVDDAAAQPHKNLKHIVDITDTTNIELLTDTIDFPSWEKLEDEFMGEPSFYILFNNGTMIRLYSEIPLGAVFNYNKEGSWYNYSGEYKIPKDFLIKVWEFIKPFSVDREPYHE